MNMKRILNFLLILFVFNNYIFSITLASEKDFIGDWRLTINQVSGGKRTQDGLLKIRHQNGKNIAHVQGGPVRIKLNGNNIEMAIDDWTGAGMPFERYYKGSLNENSMKGEFGPESPMTEKQKELCAKIPLGCPHPKGTWSAVPYENKKTTSSKAKPIDFTGRWSPAGSGLRRWTVDLTETAKQWNEDFDVELDLPRQRCISSGLVNNFGSTPEIYQDNKKVTMIFSSGIRRIYLDDRKPPEFSDWYPLGFSHGHWEGSTLVVETTHLMPSVRGFMGDPVSEDARVVERYSIDEEGILHGHMTLYDPIYYKVPPIRTAKWRKNEDKTVVFPLLCDPDSFYREIYNEGKFDEYIKRYHRRY